MLKRLLFASAMLLSIGAITPATAEMVYVPAIKWYVAGPIEWFANWLGGDKNPSERDWEELPIEYSRTACEKAINNIVKDWSAVKTWKCTTVSR